MGLIAPTSCSRLHFVGLRIEGVTTLCSWWFALWRSHDERFCSKGYPQNQIQIIEAKGFLIAALPWSAGGRGPCSAKAHGVGVWGQGPAVEEAHRAGL